MGWKSFSMTAMNKKLLTNTIIWGIITGAIYEAFYRRLDRPILYWIQQHASHGLQKCSSTLSNTFSTSHWGELGILCLILFVGFGLFLKHRQDLYPRLSKFRLKLGFLGFSIIVAAIVGTIIKYGLARYRPEMLLEKNLYGFHLFSTKHELNSTPSGHTTLSFAGLLALKTIFKRIWISWILITLAILIGLSRIIISDHYASDVILGIYVGTICTYWVKSIREW